MKIMSQYFPFLSANRVKVQKAWRTTAQDDFKKNAGIFPPFIIHDRNGSWTLCFLTLCKRIYF